MLLLLNVLLLADPDDGVGFPRALKLRQANLRKSCIRHDGISPAFALWTSTFAVMTVSPGWGHVATYSVLLGWCLAVGLWPWSAKR
jgi:hypothetical protein